MPKSDLIYGQFSTAATSGRMYKTQPINLPTPEKQVETFDVKGRSGALLIDYGAYNNVTLEAQIAIESQSSTDSYLALYDSLRGAIMQQNGYQRLEDSQYPDEYRIARAVGIEPKVTGDKNGHAAVTFDAKPQRYLKSGEQVVLTLEGSGLPDDSAATTMTGDQLGAQTQRWITEYYGSEYLTESWTQLDLRDVPMNSLIELTYEPGQTRMNGFIECTDDLTTLESTGLGIVAAFDRMTLDSAGNGSFHKYGMPSGDENYVAFLTPTRWVIKNPAGEIIGGSWPQVGTIEHPDNIVAYNPLIHMVIPTTTKSGDVLRIGGTTITLHDYPVNIAGSGSTAVPAADLYIDGETYNAYVTHKGVTYNANPYVSYDGELTFGTVNPTYVYTNGLITSVEITPRWWRV